jgi:hydrogenase maturation protease
MSGKTLVLGLGNTIMSDDGIGPKIIEQLQCQEFSDDVQLLDGGTLGLDLLPYLEGVSRLIVVDAVETGNVPGTLVRFSGEEVPLALETKISPHQMGMKDLLAVARLMGCLPDEVVLLGMQPHLLDMGTELSQAVADNMTALQKMVLQELGITLAAA